MWFEKLNFNEFKGEKEKKENSVIKPIKEALSEVFPPMTSKRLIDITKSLKSFTEKLKLSDENAKNLKETAKGFFSIFGISFFI